MKKHRLVLLLGILVALVFFYFGLNTWMESQQQKISPPPVAQFRPPVEVRKPSEPVKPKVPEPAPTPTPVGEKPQEIAKLPKPQEETPKQERGRPEDKGDKLQHKEPTQKVTREKTKEEKKVAKRSSPVKKPALNRALKSFTLQIGAFKSKDNARRLVARAKHIGYRAFIVEEGGLYKVRIKVKASSLIGALKKARKDFRGAFAVKR